MQMHLIATSYCVEVKYIWFINSLVRCSSIILKDEAKENKESGSITSVLSFKYEYVWNLQYARKKLFFSKPRAHFDAPIFIFCHVTLWRVIGFDTSYETYVMITSLVRIHCSLISTIL